VGVPILCAALGVLVGLPRDHDVHASMGDGVPA
jgi:hypothetical protein